MIPAQPTLERVKQLQSHTANCYCIEFDPTNRYFATGGADALVNVRLPRHMQ